MCASSPTRDRCLPDASRRRTILVTGFEPFGGETVNASWEASRRLDGLRLGDHVAVALQLPCAYGACVAEFVHAFEALRPEAVMMTGQAARRAVVCVERVARNVASARTPDNRGVIGEARLGRGQLESTAPVGEIVRAIRDANILARVSTNAGDYVCNHLYHRVLDYLRENSSDTPAVFLHLPATPEQAAPGANRRRLPAEDAARALRAAASALIGASMLSASVV
jgi:pyroglutamyl-peptidase